MARKDNKGRNLKNGEIKRPDGRYEFRYKDPLTGKRKSIYDQNLAELRKKEKMIQRDFDDGIFVSSDYNNMDVNTLIQKILPLGNQLVPQEKDIILPGKILFRKQMITEKAVKRKALTDEELKAFMQQNSRKV